MNSVAKMFVCLFELRQPNSTEFLTVTDVVVAKDESDARHQCEALVREGSFASGTRGWVIDRFTFREVNRNMLERAATEVLGWSAPPS